MSHGYTMRRRTARQQYGLPKSAFTKKATRGRQRTLSQQLGRLGKRDRKAVWWRWGF